MVIPQNTTYSEETRFLDKGSVNIPFEFISHKGRPHNRSPQSLRISPSIRPSANLSKSEEKQGKFGSIAFNHKQSRVTIRKNNVLQSGSSAQISHHCGEAIQTMLQRRTTLAMLFLKKICHKPKSPTKKRDLPSSLDNTKLSPIS